MPNATTSRAGSPQAEGYSDYFALASSVQEPLLLGDGTSVLFPGGWTDEDAFSWREDMGLKQPVEENRPTLQ
jgi:hypothetical protein